jgi:predicted DNA binding CopG/RHH family protein
MTRKNIMLTEKQIALVKKKADIQGISFSEMLRKIIDRFLEKGK